MPFNDPYVLSMYFTVETSHKNLSKIAVGNVRRNLNDFGVYFAALAAGACLMYSYAASGRSSPRRACPGPSVVTTSIHPRFARSPRSAQAAAKSPR